MRRSIRVSIVWLALAAGPANAQSVRELTPEESVRLALEHNPRVHAARADATAASATLRQARAARLPTVTTQADYTRLSGNIPDVSFTLPGTDSTVTFQSTELDRYQLSVGVEQTLFSGLRVGNEIRAAGHDARGADLREEQVRSDVAFDVRHAYWTLYGALAARDALAAALERVDAHLAAVGARVREGAALRRDLLAARTRRAEVDLDRVEADNAVRVGRLELNRLVGLPLGTEVRPSAGVEIDTTDAPLDDLLAAALDGRPELAALEEDADALAARARAEEGGGWPRVDFVGRYVYARPNPYFFQEQDRFHHSWELGLSTRWDLWDGGRRGARAGELEARAAAALARVDQARAEASVEIARERLEVIRAREAVQVAAAAVEGAAETFRVAREQFAEGVALSTDVLDAEEAYRNAEERRAGAAADYAMARAALLHGLGRVR